MKWKCAGRRYSDRALNQAPDQPALPAQGIKAETAETAAGELGSREPGPKGVRNGNEASR